MLLLDGLLATAKTSLFALSFVCYCHLLYDLLDILISSLHGAVRLWPVRRRVMVLYFELRVEFSLVPLSVITLSGDSRFLRCIFDRIHLRNQ